MKKAQKMGKLTRTAVKTDMWQWAVDEVKNHLEPLFGTRLEIWSKKSQIWQQGL